MIFHIHLNFTYSLYCYIALHNQLHLSIKRNERTAFFNPEWALYVHMYLLQFESCSVSSNTFALRWTWTLTSECKPWHGFVFVIGLFCLSLSDVNECEETNGGCEALCCNTIGSFYCKCPSGQELKEDGKTCQGKGHLSTINTGINAVSIRHLGPCFVLHSLNNTDMAAKWGDCFCALLTQVS